MWYSFDPIYEYCDQPIIFATDCQSLVLQLKQYDPNFTILGATLFQFCTRIGHARSVSFTYVPCYTNGVAHNLAKLGRSLSREAIWPFSSHISILELL